MSARNSPITTVRSAIVSTVASTAAIRSSTVGQLYEMLTGRRAFEGEDISDALTAAGGREPLRAGSRNELFDRAPNRALMSVSVKTGDTWNPGTLNQVRGSRL